MTACNEKNKLYCWPCILFVVKAKEKNIWVQQGYADLAHVNEAAKKHEKFQIHIASKLSLKTFGKTRIDCMLDNQKHLIET